MSVELKTVKLRNMPVDVLGGLVLYAEKILQVEKVSIPEAIRWAAMRYYDHLRAEEVIAETKAAEGGGP